VIRTVPSRVVFGLAQASDDFAPLRFLL
jgi:hypothetical protein